MARITVEDCLQQVNNRFTIIHMASQRVRQLRKGADPLIPSKNKDIVLALREIASGHVLMTHNTDKKNQGEKQLDALPVESGAPGNPDPVMDNKGQNEDQD